MTGHACMSSSENRTTVERLDPCSYKAFLFCARQLLGMLRQVGDWVQYSTYVTDTGSLSTQWLHVSLQTHRAPLRYGRPVGASSARQRSLVIFQIVTRKARSEFSLPPPPPCQVRFGWARARKHGKANSKQLICPRQRVDGSIRGRKHASGITNGYPPP